MPCRAWRRGPRAAAHGRTRRLVFKFGRYQDDSALDSISSSPYNQFSPTLPNPGAYDEEAPQARLKHQAEAHARISAADERAWRAENAEPAPAEISLAAHPCLVAPPFARLSDYGSPRVFARSGGTGGGQEGGCLRSGGCQTAPRRPGLAFGRSAE